MKSRSNPKAANRPTESGPANIFWTESQVTRKMRLDQNGHKSFILWLTGLSGAGKTTLARMLETRLFEDGRQVVVLDGDNVRHGLCADLGFSAEDRTENIRRVGEVCGLMIQGGIIAISAFISPYNSDRDRIRARVEEGDFIEVYLKCSLEECERRDPKGLYKKARLGEIKDLTGVDAPYEAPSNPEIIVDTERLTPEQSIDLILNYLQMNDYLPNRDDSTIYETEFAESVV